MKYASILGCTVLFGLLMAGTPVHAQVDLSGEWTNLYHEDAPERGPGPAIGDYLGLPINDAARLRAESWRASLLTVAGHQCKPHPADYGPSVSDLRIWKEVGADGQAVAAWRTRLQWMAPERTIWMDGRPHPPAYVAHTWQGFSTGQWRGDMLMVTTTHLKAAHVRRNGVPRSDEATLTEYFDRHGDTLTWVSIVHDPVYLSEAYMRTRNFARNPRQVGGGVSLCVGTEEIAGRSPGYIPHHLPGANPYLAEFSDYYGVGEAARGGAETMYPEYRFTVTGTGPPVCERYCFCIGIQGAACPLEGTGF